MPRPPAISGSVAGLTGSVFSRLAHRLATFDGEVYPLHVGDTWLAPPVGPERLPPDPARHRYASPAGLPALVEALVARIGEAHGVPTGPDDLLVATGATGALDAVLGAILDPGDEVLVLAPTWPLVLGIVTARRGRPVPVDVLGVDDASEVVRRLESAWTGRTVALYLGTPNNPTGRVLPPAWLERLAAWARGRGLTLLADEVYERHQFVGAHVPMRALAPERTVSVHSFSKAYGLAGHRIGHAVGPAPLIAAARKVLTHSVYSVSRVSQELALACLGPVGEAWVARSREAAEEAGRATAEALGLPPPDGGTFVFVDVGEALDDRGLPGFLEDAADRGLFLAPGPGFGPYPTHVRLCFTAAPPEVTARGVAILADLLGRRT